MLQHNHYSRFLTFIYDTALHIPIRKIRQSVTRVITHHKAQNVIDLCCGTGNQLLYLQKADIQYLKGVDVSDNMLRQAKLSGLSDVCFKMDASQTDFKDNSFDAAVMSFSLHETHADIANAIFNEARRIVKSGGLLVVVDYCFDEKTHFLGRFAARAVEKMVGGDHYRNFKYFMNHDLLSSFSKGLKVSRCQRFLLGAAALWVYENR